MKWKEDLAAAYDIVSKGSRNNGIVSAVNLQLVPAGGVTEEDDGGCFYENVGFDSQRGGGEVEGEVYDFPRPRGQDNLYINENFEEDIMPTYDTPRKKQEEDEEEEEEMEGIDCEYDVPKV